MSLIKLVKSKVWPSGVLDLPEDKQWVFRGLEDSSWEITSALDRAWTRIQKAAPKDPGGLTSKTELERRLLRTFKRAGSRYLDVPPKEDDQFAWLSWMQHYGAPTRLVDFSYSPWVALFFALQPRAVPVDPAERAVWAVNASAVRDLSFKQLSSASKKKYEKDWHLGSSGHFKALYTKGRPIVLKQNTYLQHERLTIQQGVFMCPGDIEREWHENLSALVPKANLPDVVRRFTIPTTAINGLLRELHRMNLTTATIYPGLQGLAESLMHRALVPFGLSVVPSNVEP